jgi:hypothetical protein
MLHVIVASGDLCKARLRCRNEMKPGGIYHGEVTKVVFEAVTPDFAPPSDEENFNITRYDAEHS